MEKKKILIVDDDVKSCKLLRAVLQKSGYQTIEASDGKEGIQRARENIPDVILMDIRMPVMDGITAAKILKKEETTRKIPLIIITSSAMKGDREKIFSEIECAAYIAKPIEIDSFLETIKKCTEG